MSQEILEAKMSLVCEKALRKAIPSIEERRETIWFSQNLAKKLESELKEADLEAKVQVEGSIAKDTWLAGEKDIDLFVLVAKAYGRDAFAKVLEVAKRVAGEDWLEAYAEHPYIEAKMNGFTVDFVPCFELERGEGVVSSVDRTPFHTLYVKKHLTPEAKNEVRLLKRFMRGIGTYGAEIKVGGFSGYLCEILTLYYGRFPRLLQAASDWREREIVDLKGYYLGREDEALKIFQEPLIVVDPVDKGRNVASAVRTDRLNEFIAASRSFLKKPSLSFFYPRGTRTLSVAEFIRLMDSRSSAFVFLKTDTIRAVSDVLWGQLYRSQRALETVFRQHGFSLVRSGVWSDEGTVNVFVFELHSRFLPLVERHLGPPVWKKKDCERFLAKHRKSSRVLSGPRIEGYRWVVERRRKYTDVADLLREKLKNGEGVGVASLVSQAFASSLEVLVNHEAREFYSRNPSFAKFLTEHLKGRPSWVK